VEKKNNPKGTSSPARNAEGEDILNLLPEMRRAKPAPDAIAAAMEAAQRLAAEIDAENAASDVAQEMSTGTNVACSICGYRNRQGNKFCAMCGVAAGGSEPLPGNRNREFSIAPAESSSSRVEPQARGNETHHYHHHYHHHYFPGADGLQRGAGEAREPAREDRMRPSAALRGDLSRAEAAVRRVTQEWVLACNIKHLDDLLDLYVADPIVMRSNYPPIRGAAAVREFFFSALDAGLGEVEMEPLRVDIAGDLGYEAGRFTALVPSASGKRREERGKYLWVCQRQANGEWRLAADCWSSDLTLTTLESDVPSSGGVKTNQPRKA
jgi:ketosteroid isomerase-like protein